MREAIAPTGLIVAAVRCWRAARDGGEAVQPCLSRALAGTHCAMLAPVFASLLALYEMALGRAVVTGSDGAMSEDERALLGLIDGADPVPMQGEGATAALACAIGSTRIMMALGLSDPVLRGRPEGA